MSDPLPHRAGIPDGIEPFVGWRYWRADEGWLCSLNKFKTWPALGPLRAQCPFAMDHGPLPGEQCGCGIYAAVDLPTLKELVQPEPGSPLVVGEVSLWGKVIPAALGFRAELAYPRRLWVVGDAAARGGPAAPLRTLADRYGVPVESCDGTWAVSGEAGNPWHLEPRVGEIRAAVADFRQQVDRLAAALAAGDEPYRAELARQRTAHRAEAIARNAFESSFGGSAGSSAGSSPDRTGDDERTTLRSTLRRTLRKTHRKKGA